MGAGAAHRLILFDKHIFKLNLETLGQATAQ